MVDVIDGSETVSTHGIINWILLLVIFISYHSCRKLDRL